MGKTALERGSGVVGGNLKIKCPSCLGLAEETELKDNNYVCPIPGCQKPIPPSYVADYDLHKPVIISAVGLRGHGKTVYFASVFRALYFLTECWPEFYHTPLDDTALRKVKEEAARLDRGELPAPTPFNPNNPPEPVLIRVTGIPMYPKCTLLFYDVSGESFTAEMEKVGSYVPFLQQAQTVLFLISVPDLSSRPALDMEELLSRYIGGMRYQRINIKKQHLVVVYTKADQMELGSGWRDLDAYLRRGLGDGMEDPEAYRKKLVWTSDRLRDYTRNELKAHQFLAKASGNFESVTFSIVSALGASPETGANGKQRVMQVAPISCRIMDPLLWAVENSQPRWKQALWWKRNGRKILFLTLLFEISSVLCSIMGVLLSLQLSTNLFTWSERGQWMPTRTILEISGEIGFALGTVGVLLAFPLLLKMVKEWLS